MVDYKCFKCKRKVHSTGSGKIVPKFCPHCGVEFDHKQSWAEKNLGKGISNLLKDITTV